MDVLEIFCTKRGLMMTLGKTKVMIFHTSPRVMQDTMVVTFSGSQVEVMGSYVYLGITFTNSSV